MLMGTAEVISQPLEQKVFLEDMTAEELVKKGATIPVGLHNLGNTCYMNSTIQCMRHMPELRTSLTLAPLTGPSPRGPSLSSLLLRTFNSLDASPNSVPPNMFVLHLRQHFPQFAELSPERNSFLQQDAEELFNTLVTDIQSYLAPLASAPTSCFSSLLGLELEETLVCQETLDEPVVRRTEAVSKLVCNINNSIDHMTDALKLGMEGSIEKRSLVLGRDALWTKKQRVSSLPRYICFQFMRFFWKPTPESRDHRGVKCKIGRAVTFPEVP
jgi:ubiquitin carboxyl-terminal hydrolase 14